MRVTRLLLSCALGLAAFGCTPAPSRLAETGRADCRPAADQACEVAIIHRARRDDAYAAQVQQDVRAMVEGMRNVD